jgi:hypothetical protein
MMVISFVRKTLYHIYQSYLTRRTSEMATLPTRRHEDEKSKTESSHKVGASAKDQVSHGTKTHSAQNDKAAAKTEHPTQDQQKPDPNDAELKALAERFVQAKNNPAEIQRIADEVKGTVGSAPPASGQEPVR